MAEQTPPNKPRISIEVSEELKREVTRFLRYGEQKIIFTTFTTAFVHMCNKFGKETVIGGFLSGDFTWPQLIEAYAKDEEKLLELPDWGGGQDGQHLPVE